MPAPAPLLHVFLLNQACFLFTRRLVFFKVEIIHTEPTIYEKCHLCTVFTLAFRYRLISDRALEVGIDLAQANTGNGHNCT